MAPPLTSRDRIRALVAGMMPSVRRNRLFLMIEVFFDDSGTGLDSPAFVFAGYAATGEKWDVFTAKWEAALKQPHRLKPEGIKYFKASEAMSFRGEFLGWTEAERDARLGELLSIVPQSDLLGFYSVIPVDQYKKVFTGKFTHSYFDHPYLVMLYSVFPLVMKRLDALGISDSVRFIFDSSEGHEAKINSTWETFVQTIPEQYETRIVPRIGFEDEKEFPPLQAADAIAWYIRRKFLEGVERANPNYKNDIFENMAQGTEHTYWVLTEERLKPAAMAIHQARQKPGIPMSLPDPSSPLSWGVPLRKQF